MYPYLEYWNHNRAETMCHFYLHGHYEYEYEYEYMKINKYHVLTAMSEPSMIYSTKNATSC